MARSVAALDTYDILAVRPMDDSLYQQACRSLDIDIITFDLGQRIPFRLKYQTVGLAIERGIFFEVALSSALGSTAERRAFFRNVNDLIRATKGKNLVFTSGALDALHLRGPYDIANLAVLFGLKSANAKVLATSVQGVLDRAEARVSYRGVGSLAEMDDYGPGEAWKVDDPTAVGEDGDDLYSTAVTTSTADVAEMNTN